MTAYPNLRHIRLLKHAIALNSLSKAADAVGISQPAASQAIAGLEEQFGGQLFERRPGGIYVTPRGHIAAARAERVLDLLRQAAETLSGQRRSGRGTGPELLETHATIAHLRALSAFARTGSFAAAARALDQAEPSVQRAAREIERIAGLTLFEGRPRTVRLSKAGLALASTASLALKELESAYQEVGELDGRFDGHVAIGMLPLVRTRIIPLTLATWCGRRPQASIEMIDGSYDVLIHALALGEIDMLVGALRESPGPRGFVQEMLFEDGLVIVARSGHPLLAKARVAPRDLAAYPWVLPRKGTPTRTIFDCFAAEHGIGPAFGLVETGSLVAIRGILLESDRLAVLSPSQIVYERAAGLLAALPVDLPATQRPIGVTTRQGWMPTALQAEFLDDLRQACRKGG
ncbi:MAG: LysR family transcriptional regulator [Rhizobiaceae bacterium]